MHYYPVHLQPYYISNGFKADVPVTERIWKELLTLPLYPTLVFSDQDRVINAIYEFGKVDEGPQVDPNILLRLICPGNGGLVLVSNYGSK